MLNEPPCSTRDEPDTNAPGPSLVSPLIPSVLAPVRTLTLGSARLPSSDRTPYGCFAEGHAADRGARISVDDFDRAAITPR
jgi:hypothetical protein